MSFEIKGFIKSFFKADRNQGTFAEVKSLEEPDIFSQIMQLNQVDDREYGFQSSFAQEAPSRRIVYVRDATSLAALDGQDRALQAKVSQAARRQIARVSDCYLMMALSYTAALKKLLIVHQIDFEDAVFQRCVDQMTALSQGKRSDRFEVAFQLGMKHYFAILLKQFIVPAMLESGLAATEEAALSTLDKVKDWVGLEHDPISMVTINKWYNPFHRAYEWIIRVEEPVTTLTQEQKQQLEDYQDEYWYERLSSDEKMLFKSHYRGLLLSDAGRVIPSQLRSKIPFLKNAYRHKTYLVRQNEGQYTEELLLDVGHCGGLPYFDKQPHDNEYQVLLAAKGAISQLANYARSHTEVDRRWQHHSITLNSLTVDGIRELVEPVETLFKLSKKKIWPALLFIPYVAMTLIAAVIKLAIFVTFTVLPFGSSLKRLLDWTGSKVAAVVPSMLKKGFMFLYDNIWSLGGLVRPYVGFDHHIVKKTKEASGIIKGCYSSNMCLNAYSAIEPHDYDGIFEIIKQAEGVIQLLHQHNETRLAKSFQKNLDDLTNEIGQFDLLALKIKFMSWSLSPVVLAAKSFGYLMRVTSLVSTVIGVVARCVLALVRQCLPSKLGSYFRLDKDVSAMQVMGKLGKVVPNFDRAYNALPSEDIPKIHLWFGCASGDNRTGLAAFKMQEEVITEQCAGKNAEQIKKRLAMDGHTQRVGSVQSSIGRFGHRKKSSYSFRAYSDAIQEYFFTPYSDVKSVKGELASYEKYRESLSEEDRLLHDKNSARNISDAGYLSLLKVPPPAISRSLLDESAADERSSLLPRSPITDRASSAFFAAAAQRGLLPSSVSQRFLAK